MSLLPIRLSFSMMPGMNVRYLLIPTLMAGSATAGPLLIENFACPGIYQDGQPVAGVTAKEGVVGGGWQMDDARPNQNPSAFLAGKAFPKKPEDPAVLKEEREKIKEEDKSLDREARAKAEAKRDAAAKGKTAVASLRTTPGVMVLAPVDKGSQNIVLPLNLPEPLEPPFYFSVLLELGNDSQGAISFSLEDEAADLPVSLFLHKPVEKFWAFSAGGAQAGVSAAGIRGPMFIVLGIEEHATERGKWVAKAGINPFDSKTPFFRAAAANTVKLELDPKSPVRLRITKGPKVVGRIDEIRFGTNLRDVFP